MNGVPYNEIFKYFLPIEKIVNTYEKVENGIVALGDQLKKDGVIYAEIRTGLKDLGEGYEEYLLAVLRGIARCRNNVKIKLLLSLRRNTMSYLSKLIDLAIRYKEQGVVGIDISGDSTLGQISDIIPEIHRARSESLYLALHLGESPKEVDSLDKEIEQAAILAQLKPDRIGHGVFLSTQSIEWVLANPLIPIEVCPTSSTLTGMIDNHLLHPGLAYYMQHKHPIIVGTDDPLLFNSSLTEEYQKLMQMESINMEQILQLISWSFDFSFLKNQEKLRLKNCLTDYYIVC